MPPLHQYFGTPFTTWILNRLYGSKFSDIHCGMRGHHPRRAGADGHRLPVVGVRLGDGAQVGPHGAARPPRCRSPSSRTARAGCPTTSGPAGSRRSPRPGSTCARCSSTAPSSSSSSPGIVLLAAGLLLTLPLSFGDITIGPVTFSLYTMLVGVALSVIGLQSIYFGCLAHVFLDYGGPSRERWRRIFAYTKMMVISGVGFALGAGACHRARRDVHQPATEPSRPPRPSWSTSA